VDTQTGKSIAARRVEGSGLATLADRIIADILPLLASACGTEQPTLPSPVGDLTTGSPAAYEHYVAGNLALEEWRELDAVAEFERAAEIDSTFALAYYELSRIHFNNRTEIGPTYDYAEKAWNYRARLGLRDRLLVEAWREQLQSRIMEAIDIYREMLTRWPDDKEVLVRLSGLYYNHWMREEGESLAKQGMALYPDVRLFVNMYADFADCSGRPNEAVEVSRRFAERHPNDGRAWVALAYDYLVMGLPDSSEAICHRAIEIESDPAIALMALAHVDYARGNLQQAIDKMESILERIYLPKGGSAGLLIFGWHSPTLPYLYVESGRFHDALALYDEARQSVSDQDSEVAVELSRCRILLRAGMAGEALALARDVAERTDRLQNLGNAAMQELKALVALDSLAVVPSVLEKYRQYNIEGTRSHLVPENQILAEIALKNSDPESALDILLEMQGFCIPPLGGWYNIEWREAMARAYRMAGRLSEAAGVHEETLRRFGGHVLSHYDLGQIYEEMGRTEDAEREYVVFLEAWAEADAGLPQVEDARQRLASLRMSH
jgi:tetratricopeptide (TPR) repeat protein